MVLLFDITSLAAGQPLLFGIPESVGLLAFGVGLTATAVIVRKFLNRSDAGKSENEGDTKA